jgi:hypothetical protein
VGVKCVDVRRVVILLIASGVSAPDEFFDVFEGGLRLRIYVKAV